MTDPRTTPADDDGCHSTQDLLVTIHELTLKRVLDQLQSGEPLRASWLREARQLLADNGIDAEAVERLRRSQNGRLADYGNLPFPLPDGDPF